MDASLIVVGGGPVGAAIGMGVPDALVLESSRFPRDKVCGEGLMPNGARVLAELGLDLAREGFPALAGVSYRLEGGEPARASFSQGVGFGTRRLRLDSLLAARAGVRTGVTVRGVADLGRSVEVETSAGTFTAASVVLADGMRSRLARSLPWARGRESARRRYALVGHLEMLPLSRDVEVTLLGRSEVYVAPVGDREVLAAVLGLRGALRDPGNSVSGSYRRALARVDPRLAQAPMVGRLRGAGPFGIARTSVARGRIFLAGDAAGFLDPLTGDALAAGLEQARVLADLLRRDPGGAAARYASWFDQQWRRRKAVTRLALWLSGRPAQSSRSLRALGRHPETLQALVDASQGLRRLRSLTAADWAVVAGMRR